MLNMQYQQSDANTTSDSGSHSTLQPARMVSLTKVKPTIVALGSVPSSPLATGTSPALTSDRHQQSPCIQEHSVSDNSQRKDEKSRRPGRMRAYLLSTYSTDSESDYSEESHECYYTTSPEEAPSVPKCCYLNSRIHSWVMHYDYRDISLRPSRADLQRQDDHIAYLKIHSWLMFQDYRGITHPGADFQHQGDHAAIYFQFPEDTVGLWDHCSAYGNEERYLEGMKAFEKFKEEEMAKEEEHTYLWYRNQPFPR